MEGAKLVNSCTVILPISANHSLNNGTTKAMEKTTTKLITNNSNRHSNLLHGASTNHQQRRQHDENYIHVQT